MVLIALAAVADARTSNRPTGTGRDGGKTSEGREGGQGQDGLNHPQFTASFEARFEENPPSLEDNRTNIPLLDHCFL